MLIVEGGAPKTVSHIVQGEHGYYYMWDKYRYRVHHYWLIRFRYLDEAEDIQAKHLMALRSPVPYEFHK